MKNNHFPSEFGFAQMSVNREEEYENAIYKNVGNEMMQNDSKKN